MKVRLLIVDDVEDNRLVLKAICRKMEEFEIREAVDGLDAVIQTESWQPHIILMDVMMPNVDGFEASRVIKERFPKTHIIVVTAVMDPQMESNMSSIGVSAYLHKPIDKELLRFKLQSIAVLLRSKEGDHATLSAKSSVVNPFSSDIRHFKTIFDITDSEGVMDFGAWMLSRCEGYAASTCSMVDPMLELFYELMRQSMREGAGMKVVIEESFEELFVTMQLDKEVTFSPKAKALVEELTFDCLIKERIVCARLRIGMTTHDGETVSVVAPQPQPLQMHIEPTVPQPTEKPVKEVRLIDQEEQELLRRSFVHKTTAQQYISDLGGDVLDEIRDLESVDAEWMEMLARMEHEPTAAQLGAFADEVLGAYVRAINNLFEFTALAYALSSLGSFLKAHAQEIAADRDKWKLLIMLMEHLGGDLVSWREHLFILQDAADIHYLDSSFFSSCMQIEGIIAQKQLASDDDGDLEFF